MTPDPVCPPEAAASARLLAGRSPAGRGGLRSTLVAATILAGVLPVIGSSAAQSADGYDRLAPALASDPDNPDLNMALARLYDGAQQPREALQITEALVRRDPANVDVRRSAVAAALRAGDSKRATELVREGLDIAPEDPKSWMASADVARAAGNNQRALRDLARARELRLQQLGYADNGDDDSTLTNITLIPGQDPIRTRATLKVKLAAIGSNDAPGFAVPVYAGADLGQDAPDALATPPGYGRPTPLTPASVSQPYAAPPAPIQAYTVYTPAMDTPQATPEVVPRRRVLDTTQTDNLPPPIWAPRAVAQAATSPADALNARQLGGRAVQPAAYAAPQPPQQGYVPAYSQPQVLEPGAVPTYPGYLPVSQNVAAPPQLSPEELYQPQIQEYLPQYRPAPPPSPGQQLMDDDSQFPRAQDFNAPYRPYLPRITGDETAPYGQTTQGGGPTRYYDNPFRRSPDSALQASVGQNFGNGITSTDPVTQEIDRSIVALRDSLAPSLQGTLEYQGHNGESGLSKMTDLTVPMEATFSPGGTGQVKLTVTPTDLLGGRIGGTDANLQRFGTLAFGLKAPSVVGSTYYPAVYSGTRPGTQTADGVGLDAQYTLGDLSGDVGVTPTSFPVTNVVGGLEWAPQLGERARLRMTLERRAITETLLSYAGTTDPRTGKVWGGVVRDYGKASLEFSDGLAGMYIMAGGGLYTGQNVVNNTEYDAGAGISYPLYKQGDEEIRAGLDLHYTSFAKNLSYYTYGQGGYFSPQNWVSAIVPITYRNKFDEDLSYELGASVGLQSFTQRSSKYFPNDPSLQAQLVTAAASDTALSTTYLASTTSGFAGGANAKLDYRVSTNLHVGGRVGFQKSGIYQEYMGALYARYVFNGVVDR